MTTRIAPRAASSVSTNRAKAAPRDSASSPSAPEPANRSITRRPSSPGDQAAWNELHGIYRPFLLAFLRGKKLTLRLKVTSAGKTTTLSRKVKLKR